MSNLDEREEKKLNVQKIAIAGLLHDIGKFWQRTSPELRPFIQSEKDYFQTYVHALYGSKFIGRYIGDSEIESWVREHHDEFPSID